MKGVPVIPALEKAAARGYRRGGADLARRYPGPTPGQTGYRRSGEGHTVDPLRRSDYSRQHQGTGLPGEGQCALMPGQSLRGRR